MDNKMLLEEKNLEVDALENLAKGFSSLALLSKNPLAKLVRELQLDWVQANLRNVRNERERILLTVNQSDTVVK